MLLTPELLKERRLIAGLSQQAVADTVGLNVNLTSHVGRHTMGGFIVDAKD